jgi:DNA-directed RNA polymerase sigma subunit (sigma70/sigma32)
MKRGILVDTPRVAQGFEVIFDTLGLQLKTAPGVLNTQTGDLTTDKEWLMPNGIVPGPDSRADTLKGIARTHLELARAHYEKAHDLRTHYAGLARNYGMTNQEIGDVLGVTEARVRQILAVA